MAKPKVSKSKPGGRAKQSADRQENYLIDLIERAETLKRYKVLYEKMTKGSLDVPAFIKEVSMDAALTLAHLMNNSFDEGVRLNAAKDLLDRAGFNKTSKHQIAGFMHVDHDTSKMELVNLILSSARRAGIPVKEELVGELLVARPQEPPLPKVLEVTALDMHPGSFESLEQAGPEDFLPDGDDDND